ncbi:MAG: type II toxin-antitoxin system prevent-host-death family antitoxin [Nevskia sp.]|jgi:prevent-host-death family protein|nr:type II toxin-antitoxin system prevent-host-death family antitoxin [Nevskia sp.]
MQINIRELKASLSATLRRVRDGERIEITSRGKVVATLVPPAAVRESTLDILKQQSWLRVGAPTPAIGLTVPVHLDEHGPSLTDLLIADRDGTTEP